MLQRCIIRSRALLFSAYALLLLFFPSFYFFVFRRAYCFGTMLCIFLKVGNEFLFLRYYSLSRRKRGGGRKKEKRKKSERRDHDDGVWVRRMREKGEEEVKNISTGQTIYHSEKSRNDVFMRCVTIKHWRGIMRENRATEQNK